MVKTEEEIEQIRIACRISKFILKKLGEIVKVGISTKEIEMECEKLMQEKGVTSAFKNYNGYPSLLCISVNEEIVHGIPSTKKILKEGDIVSIDIGVVYNGYIGDTAETFPVGKIAEKHLKLLEVTKLALYKGIEKAISGNRVGDISNTIQEIAESNGFSVVKEFAGHGVGKNLHESPEIPNFGKYGNGEILKENMVIAIEPMINEGSPDIEILSDGWTAITKDRKYSAHFEETVLIKKDKSEILTISSGCTASNFVKTVHSS